MNNRKNIGWWILALVVVIGGIWGVSTYNGLVKQEQAINSQWSQIEVVMQRRNDLVPNLVNSVKGSMTQEQKVFGQISDARKAYANANTDAQKAQASNDVTKSVGTLVNVIQESYPKLSSNENVQTLMTQLEGSENRISVERRRYNQKVETYNASISTFPKNVFANMAGLHKKDYFKAEKGAEKAPNVDLNTNTSSSGK